MKFNWLKAENIRVINENQEIVEGRRWKFNRRNINKIAYEYDAKVIKFEADIRSATLKDSKGRLLWVCSE